jgi:hypothetical protein
MDRRRFLAAIAQTVPAFAIGESMLGQGFCQSTSSNASPGYTLPDHLPKKLSIGMFIWNWITMATPGEPYHDLEQVMAGLRERGFNAVRADVGLNWCFQPDGSLRGEMDFRAWIPGHSDNLSSCNAKGGGRHDVLKRVVRLMELAKQYGIHVILTSWEYQDSSWFVADPKIQAEVMAIPVVNRFMHMARQQDRLLTVLKDKGIQKNVAFVEVHNEPDYSLFPQGAEGKRLHEEAIAMLRDRHADVLVSADYGTHDPAVVPDNAQVYDQHSYVGLYQPLFAETIWHKDFDPSNPRKNVLLRQVLKSSFMPYDEFLKAAQNVRQDWRAVDWLYDNIDRRAFDALLLKRYQKEKTALEATAVKHIEGDAKEAARRGIPAVCDECGYWYPPLDSRFEVTQPGMSLFELQTGLAIRHGYWGKMPTTYCGPEHPIWSNVEWLQKINSQFQEGERIKI